MMLKFALQATVLINPILGGMRFVKISRPGANMKAKKTLIHHRGTEKALFGVEGLIPEP